MGYPLVHISNSTGYAASGKVYYASAFCSDDDYSVAANGEWKATSRGVCLVTGISATLYVNGQPVQAQAYSSSGTSYSQYAIIQTSPGNFAVTRITNLADDIDVGALEAEPATAQK